MSGTCTIVTLALFEKRCETPKGEGCDEPGEAASDDAGVDAAACCCDDGTSARGGVARACTGATMMGCLPEVPDGSVLGAGGFAVLSSCE